MNLHHLLHENVLWNHLDGHLKIIISNLKLNQAGKDISTNPDL